MTEQDCIDIEANAKAELGLEVKELDDDERKAFENLLRKIQCELNGSLWCAFEQAEADVLRVDVVLLTDTFVSFWLELADDILELATKAHAVIEYHVGEPEKQREVIALTIELIRAGEEIELANKHAAAVKWVAETRIPLVDEDQFAAARLAARLAEQNLESQTEPGETVADVQTARARAEAAIAELRRNFEERLPEIRSIYTGDGRRYHVEHEAAILNVMRNPAEVLEKAKSAGILGEMKAGIPMIRMHAEQIQVVAGDFQTMIEALSIDRGMQTEMMAIAERLLEADEKIKEAIDEAAQAAAPEVTAPETTVANETTVREEAA
ncbi:hypothetical protein B0A48_13190 [Cryoendolithus antarcticus]|uniref:Uncharacterized protein n=1 Tax=Cryoendolithus antarcticus TaxID=1507870 RepID=A0A1V8SNQ5_9PEZI|nr:hypothetical protein B0A48_13190 [Cryoendolithus antarcticus]